MKSSWTLIWTTLLLYGVGFAGLAVWSPYLVLPWVMLAGVVIGLCMRIRSKRADETPAYLGVFFSLFLAAIPISILILLAALIAWWGGYWPLVIVPCIVMGVVIGKVGTWTYLTVLRVVRAGLLMIAVVLLIMALPIHSLGGDIASVKASIDDRTIDMTPSEVATIKEQLSAVRYGSASPIISWSSIPVRLELTDTDGEKHTVFMRPRGFATGQGLHNFVPRAGNTWEMYHVLLDRWAAQINQPTSQGQ